MSTASTRTYPPTVTALTTVLDGIERRFLSRGHPPDDVLWATRKALEGFLASPPPFALDQAAGGGGGMGRPPAGWLAGQGAKHLARAARRRRLAPRCAWDLEALQGPPDEPWRAAAHEELRRAVRRARACLTRIEARAWSLYFHEGASYAEIAVALDLPSPRSVERLLASARHCFRRALQPWRPSGSRR